MATSFPHTTLAIPGSHVLTGHHHTVTCVVSTRHCVGQEATFMLLVHLHQLLSTLSSCLIGIA
eukprot:3059316-Rhodomonas_salina.6